MRKIKVKVGTLKFFRFQGITASGIIVTRSRLSRLSRLLDVNHVLRKIIPESRCLDYGRVGMSCIRGLRKERDEMTRVMTSVRLGKRTQGNFLQTLTFRHCH